MPELSGGSSFKKAHLAKSLQGEHNSEGRGAMHVAVKDKLEKLGGGDPPQHADRLLIVARALVAVFDRLESGSTGRGMGSSVRA